MRAINVVPVLIIVIGCGPNVPKFMEATIDGAPLTRRR